MRAIGTTQGRSAWLLAVDTIADVAARVAMPTARFTVLLALDARDASDEGIRAAASALIDAGAAYFVCVGPGCGEVEALIDEEAIRREAAGAAVICTTSHEGESLEEAVFFFVDCAFPGEAYLPDTGSMLAIVVGNDLLAKHVERELAAYCAR